MPADWKSLIERAERGDVDAAAGLYSAAAVCLHHFGQHGELADKLKAVVRAVRKLTPYPSADHRARAIAKGVGLNRKCGPKSAAPDKAMLESAGVPDQLACFVAARMAAATESAGIDGTLALRARRITQALWLNRPIGSPSADQRSHEPSWTSEMIHVEQSPRFPGGDFLIEIDRRETITPARIVATVESFLEGQPDRTAKDACRLAAEKLSRPPESVEVIYYREQRSAEPKK
jgi:hypothetical protein